MVQAVFLDRDGVLMPDEGHVLSEDFVNVPSFVGTELRRLSEAGFFLVIVTNQSAIGHHWLTLETLDRIHMKMQRELQAQGADINAIYTCPHTSKDNCFCRKPSSGMIWQASIDHDIDLPSSWLIGDRTTDIQAAESAGVTGILIQSPDDLSEAVNHIVLLQQS